MSLSSASSGRGSSLSRPVFALVLLTFLMPFLSVSCAGSKLHTVSGADLVMGKEVTDIDWSSPDLTPRPGRSTTVVEPEPWAIAAAVAAVLGLLGGGGAMGFLFGVGGVGSLLMLRWALLRGAGPIPEGMSLDFEWGFWLAIVGFGVAAALSADAANRPIRLRRSDGRASRREQDGLRACPSCEEMIPTSAAFCQRCGQDVSAVPPGVWPSRRR